MRPILLSILLALSFAYAQQPYYPPLNSENWDSLPASQLGWQTDRIDSLYRFLAAKNTKSFMVLKDGKRVLEQYFDSYTQDSFWYWASAGKSAAAFLVGMAQDEGLLSIQDKTSDYLGAGWTSLSPAQEEAITVWHQITMTTGLDDGIPPSPQVPDPLNCLDAACLQYLAPPGTRWAYHNAPYRLVQDVVAAASGMNINQYTRTRLFNRTGMRGLWANYVLYGRARDMARFGLLVLRDGIWEQDTLLRDTAYLRAMSQPSQNMNPAYGYLWWLNGQSNYLPPRVQLSLPGPLVPTAPMDMFAALGKNDQKIYIVPSQGLVVVRQGNSANTPVLGPSSFDSELWEILTWLHGPATAREPDLDQGIQVFPVPARERLMVEATQTMHNAALTDLKGRMLYQQTSPGLQTEIPVSNIPAGIYLLRLKGKEWQHLQKVVIQSH